MNIGPLYLEYYDEIKLDSRYRLMWYFLCYLFHYIASKALHFACNMKRMWVNKVRKRVIESGRNDFRLHYVFNKIKMKAIWNAFFRFEIFINFFQVKESLLKILYSMIEMQVMWKTRSINGNFKNQKSCNSYWLKKHHKLFRMHIRFQTDFFNGNWKWFETWKHRKQ